MENNGIKIPSVQEPSNRFLSSEKAKKSEYFSKSEHNFSRERIFVWLYASEYAERKLALVKVHEEYFTAFCGGKEECLCRVALPFSEGEFLHRIFDELYDSVRAACESGELISMYGQPSDLENRFSVTPYRYICKGTLYRMDDEIISCKIEVSLDARFPGGVHLSRTYGFLCDEKLGILISPKALPIFKLCSDIKKGKDPRFVYADDEGIHILFFDGSECLCQTERFFLYYKETRKHILRVSKKEKKGIDKRRKL